MDCKLVSHYKVLIITSEMINDGRGPIHCGNQKDPNPVIQSGFLIYENLNRAMEGINLAEVIKFVIEPQYISEK